LVQNNFVRASPSDVEKMEPGVLFALEGIWQGRGKYLQDKTPKKGK
jgi:hypothetical protein